MLSYVDVCILMIYVCLKFSEWKGQGVPRRALPDSYG